jgi:hypothetical protein
VAALSYSNTLDWEGEAAAKKQEYERYDIL